MSEEPIVTIEKGSLRGCLNIDYQGVVYYSFRGIPYAKPPLGKLRFKAPQPADSWTGIRDATKDGNRCYSKNPFIGEYSGSEDCLFLNVHTSEIQLNENSLKPVMVWIHGGGLIYGSGDSVFYGPDYLITEGVVVVTINYRLGLLGFLSFNNEALEITGNAGFKDQVMALKWVNKNIVHFGGDPNNVTIFGESAGAVAVQCLIVSPMAKGLFHKAVMQSGTIFCTPLKFFTSSSALMSALGMDNIEESKALEIFQNMPVDELLRLQEKLLMDPTDTKPNEIGIVLESKNAKDPFVTEDVLHILHSGNYNHVPLMIGYTSREGLMHEVQKKVSTDNVEMEIKTENIISQALNISKKNKLYKFVRDKIFNFYFDLDIPFCENNDQFSLFLGDLGIVHPLYTTIKHHILASDQPIYFYRMSVDSKLNVMKRLMQIPNPGACHGDDLGYLFKNVLPVSLLPSSVELRCLKVFTKLWTQFAKTGNPNPVDRDTLINVTWKPVEVDQYHFLDIGDNLTVGINPEHDRVKFWEEIYQLILQQF